MSQKIMLQAAVFLLFLLSNYEIPAKDTRGFKQIIKSKEGNVVASYHESHALLVGISDYTNGWPDLPNAVKDCQKIKNALMRHGFDVEIVENPTKKELHDAIRKFMYTFGIDSDNRLLFFFAGHGHTLKMSYGGQLGYIVPADAPLPYQNQAAFMDSTISMQDFENQARQIQAKHVLYFFDSCFSGSIFALSRAIPQAISEKINLPVRQFIVSGTEEEEVPDESVFAEQLVLAVQGEGDMTKDGYITGTELGLFLQDKVEKYSNATQHPQYGKIRDPNLDKGDFVFILDTIDRAPMTGTVYIRTEPWCEILFDNKILTSPCFIQTLSLGPHQLILRRNGYREIAKDIQISEDNLNIKIFERLDKE
jgi:hypothetical protein